MSTNAFTTRRELIEAALAEEVVLTILESHIGESAPVTVQQRKVVLAKLRAAIELTK